MSDLVRSVRWLVIPAAVFLLIMIGLALSAEPPPETDDQARGEGSSADQADPADDSASPTPPPPQTGTEELSTEPPSVTISSGDATIEVRFDPDGVARVSAEGQDGEFDLVPGTGSGLLVSQDDNPDGDAGGGLEPVPPGMLGPDDLGLTPTDRGVELNAPGNPPIELRPDGRLGGVSATEFDGDDVTSLDGDGGLVTLADGTTVNPIELPGDGTEVAIAVAARELPWRWIATTIAALAVASALTGYLLHRNHVEPALAATMSLDWAADGAEDLDGFLKRLAADPDPNRAIRLAFHAVEQGLSGLPMRAATETPFEWHRRVSETVPAVEHVLGEICDLYARARFAPGRATGDDRLEMIDHLRDLVHGTHTPQPTGPVEAYG